MESDMKILNLQIAYSDDDGTAGPGHLIRQALGVLEAGALYQVGELDDGASFEYEITEVVE